jgi:hypothetical protein
VPFGAATSAAQIAEGREAKQCSNAASSGAACGRHFDAGEPHQAYALGASASRCRGAGMGVRTGDKDGLMNNRPVHADLCPSVMMVPWNG